VFAAVLNMCPAERERERERDRERERERERDSKEEGALLCSA